ncbi:1208_t:CDS:2 [Funneliformis geosporum]|uniref:1476_t:CDS:1 n=1 Tax=Funneliformis geosporum TaxID=1117311 RepID=A0A9W4SZR5_9GLOM|nr:1208_t:CDS:2 [Funneliformis geosporum]CAI2186809.1 1476_t:CDS:2 [Funneliformis geosporum]
MGRTYKKEFFKRQQRQIRRRREQEERQRIELLHAQIQQQHEPPPPYFSENSDTERELAQLRVQIDELRARLIQINESGQREVHILEERIRALESLPKSELIENKTKRFSVKTAIMGPES